MNVSSSAPPAPAQGGHAPGQDAGGSRAESPPVTDDRHESVSFDAAQGGDDGGPRDAVLLSQVRYGRQPLLWLPFARIDSRSQSGLNAPARQFRSTVGWHSAMIASAV
jgi:hypothetical protein